MLCLLEISNPYRKNSSCWNFVREQINSSHGTIPSTMRVATGSVKFLPSLSLNNTDSYLGVTWSEIPPERRICAYTMAIKKQKWILVYSQSLFRGWQDNIHYIPVYQVRKMYLPCRNHEALVEKPYVLCSVYHWFVISLRYMLTKWQLHETIVGIISDCQFYRAQQSRPQILSSGTCDHP